MLVDHSQKEAFLEALWGYYAAHERTLPWRETDDPYEIMVSEMMLQQTQVPRVIPKYRDFLVAFPDVSKLAAAPMSEVLKLWSGLGYNRRARYLHQSAQTIVDEWRGVVPADVEQLSKLPGIGRNTAGAIVVYAYNTPEYFIETNVRTVYIHHFFKDVTEVDDNEIMSVLRKTLDAEQPRDFYWALMDYGTWLKVSIGNRARDSKHYKKQSPFAGSIRQLRGQVIKQLLVSKKTISELNSAIPDERLSGVLDTLISEGLIKRIESSYQINE